MSKLPAPKWYRKGIISNMQKCWHGSLLYNKISEILEDNGLLLHSYISPVPWRGGSLETNRYSLDDDLSMGIPIKSESCNLFIRAHVLYGGLSERLLLRCFGYMDQKCIIKFTIQYGKHFEKHFIKKLRQLLTTEVVGLQLPRSI